MLGDKRTQRQVFYLQAVQCQSLTRMVDIETYYLAMLIKIDHHAWRDFNRVDARPLG